MKNQSIQTDPVITKLLDKVPSEMRGSFSDAQLVALKVALTIGSVLGVLILYLVKSALGIDLIPGFSFGVWGWFQEEFLR